MTDHDYYPQGNSLDNYFPREIAQFKQHTFSRTFMVRIFRVLMYMHLHAREIRLSVYQTIKWHLLKQVDLPRSPSTSSVSLMNNNVPEVVTHHAPEVVTNCASNTFQKFQLPQGFAIQNINNSNISFHFHH